MLNYNYTEEYKYNDFPALIEVVMKDLDYKKWQFEIVHVGKLSDFSSAIILQSEYCKIRVWTSRDRPYEQSEIYYSYGRLHALNEKHTMKFTKWGNREYTCWHNHLNLYLVLCFLDNLSPVDVALKEIPIPDTLLKFNEENHIERRHERFVKMQNAIWNYYGQRLFSFYDVRTPSLWNQNIDDFVKEFRSLKEKESSYSFYEFTYPIDIY